MEYDKLINAIIGFERLVHQGNNAIKLHYNINLSPLLAKRKGIIPCSGQISTADGVLHFKFHGQGCRLDFAGRIVDFDYCLEDYEYEGFDPHKLYDYCRNSLGFNSFEEFHSELLKLESKGLITRNALKSVDVHRYYLSK
jgi:hypothetical protein